MSSVSVQIGLLAVAKQPSQADKTQLEVARDRAVAAGHRVLAAEVVVDSASVIRGKLTRWIADAQIDAVIVLRPAESDAASQALAPLTTELLTGYTELSAARCEDTFVFVVPGSIAQAMEKLILPQFDPTTARNLIADMPRIRQLETESVPVAITGEKTQGGSGLPERMPAKPAPRAHVIARDGAKPPPGMDAGMRARLPRLPPGAEAVGHDDVTRTGVSAAPPVARPSANAAAPKVTIPSAASGPKRPPTGAVPIVVKAAPSTRTLATMSTETPARSTSPAPVDQIPLAALLEAAAADDDPTAAHEVDELQTLDADLEDDAPAPAPAPAPMRVRATTPPPPPRARALTPPVPPPVVTNAPEATEPAAVRREPPPPPAKREPTTPPPARRTPTTPPPSAKREPTTPPPSAKREPTTPPPARRTPTTPPEPRASSNELPRGKFAYPEKPRGLHPALKVLAALGVVAAGFFGLIFLYGGDSKPKTGEPIAAKSPEEPTPSTAPVEPAPVEPAPVEMPTSNGRPRPPTTPGTPVTKPETGPTTKPDTTPAPTTKPEAGSAAKPEPVAAPPPQDDCDETSCVAANYDRPCCARYKPAKSDLAPRIGGVPVSLDKMMVRAGVETIKPRVVKCGEETKVKGTVRVAISVSPDGEVTAASLESAPDPTLGACVTSAMKRAKFGKSVNGASFTYPFAF